MLTRKAGLGFALVDLLTGALIGVGVFVGLPSRWLPVDLAASGLILIQLAAGGALLARARWAVRMAAVAAVVTLAIGLGLVTALALTASWLSGVYGPVGRGGAIILVLVALLALPYLVALPLAQILWMRSNDSASK